MFLLQSMKVGIHLCLLIVRKYWGAGLFSFCPRCLVACCISGRRVRIADDVSSDAIFDVPGVSQDDDGVTVVGASSSKVVHERTQHNRPAEGLEASVLQNEWEKG